MERQFWVRCLLPALAQPYSLTMTLPSPSSSSALSDSLQLLKFVLIIFIMSHVCGCVWMLIEIMERDDR